MAIISDRSSGKNGLRFWDVLLRHGVLAYFCSHILAFDLQVQGGVLQICTAGAGAAHRMPPEQEYLHIVQAALDEEGFRYQTLDRRGIVHEWLCWQWQLPPSSGWAAFEPNSALSLPGDCLQQARTAILIAWEITSCLSPEAGHQPQTILCAHAEDDALPYLWLGIGGVERQLTVLLSRKRIAARIAGRDPCCRRIAHSVFNSRFTGAWDRAVCSGAGAKKIPGRA